MEYVYPVVKISRILTEELKFANSCKMWNSDSFQWHCIQWHCCVQVDFVEWSHRLFSLAELNITYRLVWIKLCLLSCAYLTIAEQFTFRERANTEISCVNARYGMESGSTQNQCAAGGTPPNTWDWLFKSYFVLLRCALFFTLAWKRVSSMFTSFISLPFIIPLMNVNEFSKLLRIWREKREIFMCSNLFSPATRAILR